MTFIYIKASFHNFLGTFCCLASYCEPLSKFTRNNFKRRYCLTGRRLWVRFPSPGDLSVRVLPVSPRVLSGSSGCEANWKLRGAVYTEPAFKIQELYWSRFSRRTCKRNDMKRRTLARQESANNESDAQRERKKRQERQKKKKLI